MDAQETKDVSGALEHLQTDVLRATAFFSPDEVVNLENWWQVATETEPDIRISKPSLSLHQEIGSVGNYGLTLNAQSQRVDWVLTPRPSEGGLPPDTTAGPLGEALKTFRQILARWWDSIPRTARLAFGPIIREPMVSKRDSYRRLAELLPAVQIDIERSSDFLYQINRPRNSRVVNGLSINRLGKWSSALQRPFQLVMSPLVTQMNPIGVEEHSCRIELDINTSPEFGKDLPSTQLGELFDELVGLGTELAIFGDQP